MRLAQLLIGLIVTGLVACGGDGPDGNVTRTGLGDTTVVEIPAGYDSTSVSAGVEVVWRSSDLGEPTSLSVHGESIAVADGDRVHLIDRRGRHLWTAGREGEGPGEFLAIHNLAWVHDTLIVLDARNRRLTALGRKGDLLGTERFDLDPDYPNIRRRQPLRIRADEVYQVVEGIIRQDTPTPVGILQKERGGGGGEVRTTFDGLQWRAFGNIFGEASLFGPQALVALGPDGRYAHGSGVEPCVLVESLDSPEVLRICRHREAVPVGPGIRSTSVEDMMDNESFSPTMREAMEVMFREQEIGDHFPLYEALEFGEDGRLWVRVPGPNPPDVHPWVLAGRPELGPDVRRWEVYDSKGNPNGAVLFPMEFRPQVLLTSEAYGFLELPTGEIAVAKAEWQGA